MKTTGSTWLVQAVSSPPGIAARPVPSAATTIFTPDTESRPQGRRPRKLDGVLKSEHKLGAAAIPLARRGKWTATTPFQAERPAKNAHGPRRKIKGGGRLLCRWTGRTSYGDG